MNRFFQSLGLVLALSACASGPKPADWQLNAKGAMDRAVAAYLEGNNRVEAAEMTKARSEISSTGRVDLMARAELLACASRVASLVFESCSGFEKLRQDAPPAERAYADYLAGKLQPQDINLLPKDQQISALAQSMKAQVAIDSIADRLAKLVAAGTAFQAGQASPMLVQAAVDAASSQGWRRPLLAWLGVQLKLAEKAGDSVEAARIQRRIALTLKP
ncbi:MAG: hypothetical protein H7197_04150 [Vitreoscilla sp.]|nr:hypothetical protein [Polaromonas sp.]